MSESFSFAKDICQPLKTVLRTFFKWLIMLSYLAKTLATPVCRASSSEEIVFAVVATHLFLGSVELRRCQLFSASLVGDCTFLDLLVIAT